MWTLKKISTNEVLLESASLPENWGPIFGLEGIKDRLSDLAWLGNDFKDQGWFETETVTQTVVDNYALEWNKAKVILQDTDWTMLKDAPITNEKQQEFKEYRKKIRNIKSSKGFPDNITWPSCPEV